MSPHPAAGARIDTIDPMTPRVVAVVPARMASSRFPGKPMALICGIPMIGHCYFRTAMAKTVAETWIATCDREIMDYAHSIGAKAVMTKPAHDRCTDRVAEAMLKIEAETGRRIDIVTLMQGDEPMVVPQMIDDAVRLLLEDPSLSVASVIADIPTDAEFDDPNTVKVVTGLNGRALFFSREPIPTRQKGACAAPRRRHVAIVPFRREALLRFNALPPGPLETAEAIDMLRLLEHGDAVKMALTKTRTLSVDTPEDLARVQAAMAADRLVPLYAAAAAI